MSTSSMDPILLAEPMLRFQCNLRGCCCRGWKIPFEARDLGPLLAPFDKTERVEILRDVVLLTDAEGELQKFFLRGTPPDGACQFLSERGLCGLQVSRGVEVLPHLCRAFPAFSLDYGSQLEICFDPVCPEVLNRIDEDGGPLTLTRVRPEPGSDLAVRAERPDPVPVIRLGTLVLDYVQFCSIREAILEALSDWSLPAMDRLAQIHVAMSRALHTGTPGAFRVDVRALQPGFDGFFDTCMSCHQDVVLANTWANNMRMVFDLPVASLGAHVLADHLAYDPDWTDRVDVRHPDLQPLLYRHLAHSFFNAFLRNLVRSSLDFTYGNTTHIVATAFRFALAFSRVLGRPVDRTMLKVALGASEATYRGHTIPPEVMPWFDDRESAPERLERGDL